jgi:glyoxylate/hydroxypyruvate reductase A
MAVIFHCPWENADVWQDALAAEMPDEDIRRWPDAGDPADIDFAVVWQLPDGVLQSFPNLLGISSMGAGVDGLMADPTLPEGVPVARLVDPVMSSRMAEYVAASVLHYHLQFDAYFEQQRQEIWHRRLPHDAASRPIGMLGLGELGQAAAAMLQRIGFTVSGWSRSPKDLPGITCHHGADGLTAVLGGSDIVVLLLPHTSATVDLINAGRIAQMRLGSYLINCARGELIVETDVLDGLGDGNLAGYTLDVARTEPLPEGHPFWRHPKVRITPHVSSISETSSGVRILAEQIRRVRRGEPLLHTVELSSGY